MDDPDFGEQMLQPDAERLQRDAFRDSQEEEQEQREWDTSLT